MSIFPEKTIDEVLGAIQVSALLQRVNYRTDTIQEIGDTIKCFCPIHKEAVFRTLIINSREKTYRCSYNLCAGNKGGDLIDFYAKTKGKDYDEALQDLVEQFRLPVALPATGEVIERTLEEGENFLYLSTVDESRREMFLEEALKRFQRILEIDPQNTKALHGLYCIAEHQNDAATLLSLSTQRIGLELEAGRYQEVLNLCQTHLNHEPDNLQVRLWMTDALLALERDDEAIPELMNLAELSEVNKQYDTALEAYRKISRIHLHDLDVHPMIVNVLLASGQNAKAIEECIKRAEELADQGLLPEAIEGLRTTIELAPERDDLRAKVVEYSLILGLDEQRVVEALAMVDDMIARDSLDAAARILETLCEADPHNPNLLDKLLEVKKRQDRHEEVIILQYRLADLYRNREDYASALMLLEEILAGDPEALEALNRIAELHRLEGDLDQAVEVFQTIIEQAVKRGRLDEAIAAAERILELRPDAIEHRERVINLYVQSGRKDIALGRILQLIDTLEKQQDIEALIRTLQTALEIAPDRADLIIKLATALENTGNTDEALAQRMKAAEQFIQAGRFGEAIEQLRSVLRVHGEDVSAMSLLADALARTGRLDESHNLLRHLAGIHIAADRYEQARDTLERLLSQAPEDIAALERMADVYTGLGDEDMVVATTERLLAIHQAQNNHNELVTHCRSILDLRPDHIEAHKRLAFAYDRLKKKDEVVETLLQLAGIYRSRNQDAEERKTLREVLEVNPNEQRAVRRLTLLSLAAGISKEGLEQLDRYLNLTLAAENSEEAMTFLGELLERDPEEIAYHRRFIDLLKRIRRPQEAVARLQALIAILESRQQLGDVAELYREILDIEPDNLEPRVQLIDVLLRLQRRPEAIQEYLRLSADQERKGQPDEAERAAQEILKIESDNEDAINRLVELNRIRGHHEKSIEWLNKLADLMVSRQRSLDAIDVYRRILDLDAFNVEAYRKVIALEVDLGKVDEAVAEYKTLIEIYRQTGENQQAVACQREAIALRPDDTQLRRDLVKIHLENDEGREAVAEWFVIAELQQAHQQHTAALETLSEILEYDSANIRARKMRGETYLHMGNEKQALQELLALSAQLDNPALMQAMARGPEADEPVGLPLVPEYTFESYVVGDRNNFAYATALATAKAPAKNYNPLFLYSDVGLGKTHLMQAIAHYILKNLPKARILYITAEEFTAQLIEAIQNNTMNAFRQRYRNVDALLLDDVQFLAGKERAQEEFFHLFNTLFQAKKQIVVTSDRPPKDIAHLEKRLKSRFGAGVVVDIQAPDLETRSAIIRRELQARSDVTVSPEIIAFIAQRIESNVREIKGAINQILAAHDIGGEPVTLDMVQRVLDRLLERV